MSKKHDSGAPLGGWFGTIGAFVGFGYGASIADGVGALIGLVLGAWLGLVIENIIFRLIVIALLVLEFVFRRAIFEAVIGMFS